MFVAPKALAGKHALIVEDEYAVALMTEDFLVEFGCLTTGPCATVAAALAAIDTEKIDFAVLDVNLNGEMVYPVAEKLAERKIPFLFISGYGDEAIPPGRSDWKVCTKPFRGETLATMLEGIIAGPGAPPSRSGRPCPG